MRARVALAAAAIAAVLALPASAWAHAALLKTFPEASALLDRQPKVVSLTYDEVVEPRFAIVSITDQDGRSQVAGSPRRSASDPYTIAVPVPLSSASSESEVRPAAARSLYGAASMAAR